MWADQIRPDCTLLYPTERTLTVNVGSKLAERKKPKYTKLVFAVLKPGPTVATSSIPVIYDMCYRQAWLVTS